MSHALARLNWASPPPCGFVWPAVSGFLAAFAVFCLVLWLVER